MQEFLIVIKPEIEKNVKRYIETIEIRLVVLVHVGKIKMRLIVLELSK